MTDILEEKFQQYRFDQMLYLWQDQCYRNWVAMGGLVVLANIGLYCFGDSWRSFWLMFVGICLFFVHTVLLVWMMQSESRMRIGRLVCHIIVGIVPYLGIATQFNEPRKPADLFLAALFPVFGALFTRMPAYLTLVTRLPHAAIISWRWSARATKGDPGCEEGMLAAVDFVWLVLLVLVFFLESVERRLYNSQQAAATTFLGSISHELRTPIHIVQSIVSDLLHSPSHTAG
jgi:signal transduction histidine kinase